MTILNKPVQLAELRAALAEDPADFEAAGATELVFRFHQRVPKRG